jgi:tetratricopeptide (TPR) repeat protein
MLLWNPAFTFTISWDIEKHFSLICCSIGSFMAAGMPEQTRILYNLGLLENALGNTAAAEGYLLKALGREPDNYDYLYALSTFYLEHGEKAKAMIYARQLAQKFPDDRAARQLVDAAGR